MPTTASHGSPHSPHRSSVRLDSELPPEHRTRRFVLAIFFNVLAFLVLALIIYRAIDRRW